MSTVQISNRAKRDLRKMGSGPHRAAVLDGLLALEQGAANLNVVAIAGHPPWLRLRIGDFRVLYRPIPAGWWAERIVNRRDLMEAVKTL